MSEPVVKLEILTGELKLEPVEWELVHNGSFWGLKSPYCVLYGFENAGAAIVAAKAARMKLKNGGFSMTCEDYEFPVTPSRRWGVFLIAYLVISWVFIIGIIWLGGAAVGWWGF